MVFKYYILQEVPSAHVKDPELTHSRTNDRLQPPKSGAVA
jgi:hypothetical protein